MILEKWQRNVTTSMESWSPFEGRKAFSIGALLPSLRPHHFNSIQAQTHFFLSHRAPRTFGTSVGRAV